MTGILPHFASMSRKDFTQEYPRALHVVHEKLANTADFPEFINRDEYTADEISALPDQAFADRNNRQFPIHEKAATYLSAVSYYGQCEPDNQLEVALEKAAAIHGITSDFVKVREILNGWEKVAHEEPDKGLVKFALSINFGTEEAPEITNYLPIESPADIEDASMELAKQAARNELPIEVTRVAAQNILKAAAHYAVADAQIHESCRRIGGALAPNFEKAAALIEFRKHASNVDEEGMAIYRDIVTGASQDEGNLDNFIKLAIQTDINYGVSYDDLHLDPYQIFYSGDAVADLQKMASNTVGIDGVLVPREVFCRIPGSALQRNFDPETAEKVASAQLDAEKSTAAATTALSGLASEERSALLEMSLAATV